jgi:hypothetical protein
LCSTLPTGWAAGPGHGIGRVMHTIALEQADGIRFQQWLWQRQHPSDCSATVGAFTRQDYFYALGLGAQMVSLKFNLVQALLQRQVYHFPTTHYVNPLRCPSRSFDCYFEKPTNCTRSQHRRVEPVKIHWCFDLPRRRLSRLAGLRGVHSKAWYHAQLAAFLYRPNRALRGLANELLDNMEGSIAGADQPTTVGGRNGSCVAMHIRRTDKHTEDHRTAQRSFNDFAQTFKSWGYWTYPGGVSGLRAFIGSEDKATFAQMPPLLQPHGAYWIPSRYFLMDMSGKNKFVNIRQGNQRLGELYGDIEDAARKVGAMTTNKPAKAPAMLKDEGMVLIAQILLMSGCEGMIASYSSNVAILVHDLMLARKVSRGEALHAIDVNGRVYCGCGASFCMTLERKTARETGRSIKHVVDGFRYR